MRRVDSSVAPGGPTITGPGAGSWGLKEPASWIPGSMLLGLTNSVTSRGRSSDFARGKCSAEATSRCSRP